MLGANGRSTPSSVVMASPGAAGRTTMRGTGEPRRVAKSKACNGWPHSSIT